ncbi:aldo/keto reductase [Actinomycetospora soli]|uniref:aldo/keto reductase n=1 Tax=Actinomycetospora soli TaxID=2893887 RepID=UPI001E5CB8F9|nr:aldo/keto reductase [Actinomycetospora soli]MCD2191169.1 aldo/keto reductase [Actinomycetospora soli]
MSQTLDTYRLLGRSGLRVSPLALGTATFGTEWGWGAEKDQARTLFDRYVERGGNFLDTASTYTDGSSERMLGEFIRDQRDRLVVATKYTTLRQADDPNSGGPHRKSLFASVEASLRRLDTDYIDLLHLHVWDFTTPVEEVLRGLDDLVRAGKVLYVGMSNVPAWEISRMQAIADLRGWAPLVALQPEYSLINRTAERDLLPMAREMGLGVTPFSPIGGGVLAGRYGRADLARDEPAAGEGGRKRFNAALGMVTDRTLRIADVVQDIATETDRRPAQIALAWVLQVPGVTAPVIGARTAEQLLGNLEALHVDLTDEHLARLDAVSAVDLGYPHDLLAGDHGRTVTAGDLRIDKRRP